MKLLVKKHSLLLACVLGCALTTGLVPGGASAAAPAPYTSTYTAPDGAYGTNAAWEAGYSKFWYPELQRYGTDYIEAGIAQENPALINQGLKMLDWGFAHMGSDGSFPGCTAAPVTPANVNAAMGDNFHSVSLFIESASRAVLDLRAYNPVSYSLAPGTYSAKLAGYSTQLETIAQWMTNTNWTPAGGTKAVNVPQLGYIYDQNYGHRYYLLAAGLQECSDVTGDASLVTKTYGVNWWIDQGFPRQLATGWQAAILTTSITGNTPAVLLGPGYAAPSSTANLISAVGVNPELGGYDASYQMVGALHATRYYDASTDAVRKAEVATMLAGALAWERSRQSTTGPIDATGSTRVGVEGELQDPSAKKGVNWNETIQAFSDGGRIDGNDADVLASTRFVDQSLLPAYNPIAASGAIGSNSAYDTNHNATYNIGLQKDCADWVQQGVLHENPAQIQQGLAILNWGLARQAADGSFPQTGSPYTDTATFVEAAARTVLLLQGYSAHHLYPVPSSLFTGIPATIHAVLSAATYLQNPALIAKYAGNWSASRAFTDAAALGEAATVCSATSPASSAAFRVLSQSFLSGALTMQLADGTDPENALFNGNAQLTSIRMGERLYLNGALTASNRMGLRSSISAALVRMEQVISISGTLEYSSGSISSAQFAFLDGQTVTDNPAFGVIYQRLTTSLVASI